MINTLKALIEPFSGDLNTSSEEDDKMAAVIDNAQVKIQILIKYINCNYFRHYQIANL